MCGYFGDALKKSKKALEDGVDSVDRAIDTAVDVGSNAAEKTIQAGKDISNETRRLATGTSDVEKLERLAKLWRDGVLTDEEFQAAKADLLKGI